jgi:hypothetical protein
VSVATSRNISVHAFLFVIITAVCRHLLLLLCALVLLLLLMLSTASVNKLPAANSAALVTICRTRDCLCSCSSSASLPFTVICVSVAASSDCALVTGAVLAT